MTSSGKTHTMMGTDDAPGIVPHAISEVFRTISRTPGKEFLLRLSMMEIYNEVRLSNFDPHVAGGAALVRWLAVASSGSGGVDCPHPNKQQHMHQPALYTPVQVLNDLLDPTRTNLKLREDHRKVGGVGAGGVVGRDGGGYVGCAA